MISWINPHICMPPHSLSKPDKMIDFANMMWEKGWGEFPFLIGYHLDNQIQLLSGTHRLAAAKLAELFYIPVKIWSLEAIETAFGKLDQWKIIMDDKSWNM